MSETKTCSKRGVMKLKDEIQEGDSVSEVIPLDRTYTCDCGHMEVEVSLAAGWYSDSDKTLKITIGHERMKIEKALKLDGAV